MDETTVVQPTSDAEPGSGDQSTTTPTGDRTYSADEVKKEIGDLKSAHGREVKTLTDQNTVLTAQNQELNQRLDALERQQSETQAATRQQERQRLANDPDQLAEFNRRVADEDAKEVLRRERINLEKEKLALKSERESVSQERTDATATALAAAYGVDKDKLINLTGGDPSRMADLAKELGQPRVNTEGLHADSNTNKGASELTIEQLDALPPDEYAAYWARKEAEANPRK